MKDDAELRDFFRAMFVIAIMSAVVTGVVAVILASATLGIVSYSFILIGVFAGPAWHYHADRSDR